MEKQNNKTHLITPAVFEPIRRNRWIIKMGDIPSVMFRKFKVYNDNDVVRLDTEFMQTLDYKCDLFSLFDLTDFTIQYLDPTGLAVKEAKYYIKGMNFEEIGDNFDDDISIITLKLIVTNK